MLTRQEQVQRVREVLEAKMVPCPEDPAELIHPRWSKCSGGCHGTGRIPDPQYAGLLNLVREESPHLITVKEGQGYATRTVWVGIEAQGIDGALRGAIERQIEIMCRRGWVGRGIQQDYAIEMKKHAYNMELDKQDANFIPTDHASLSALLKALGAEGKA